MRCGGSKSANERKLKFKIYALSFRPKGRNLHRKYTDFESIKEALQGGRRFLPSIEMTIALNFCYFRCINFI